MRSSKTNSRVKKQANRIMADDVTSLGSLEAEVMTILWEIGPPASGMEVMEASLYKRRALGVAPASFATIATTLRRLTEKGLLVSEKNEARTPFYRTTVHREKLTARILNNVSETLLVRSFLDVLKSMRDGRQPDDSFDVDLLQRRLVELPDLQPRAKD